MPFTKNSKQEITTILIVLRKLSKTLGSAADRFDASEDLKRIVRELVLTECEPRAHVYLIKHYLAKGCSFTLCASEDYFYKLRDGRYESYSEEDDCGFEGNFLTKSTNYEKILCETNTCELGIIYDAQGKLIETCLFNFSEGPFQKTVECPGDWQIPYKNQGIDWDNVKKDFHHLIEPRCPKNKMTRGYLGYGLATLRHQESCPFSFSTWNHPVAELLKKK